MEGNKKEDIENRIIEDLKQLLPDLIGRTKEDAIAKGIEGLLDKNKLRMLSLLFPDEDTELALYVVIGEIFGFEWMPKFVDYLLELRCSRLGWRSQQITDIAKEKEAQKRKGILGIFRKKEKQPLGEIDVVE